MEKSYKEKMYAAFQAICSMDIDKGKKAGMLTILFSIEPNHWRVVGISKEAIRVFSLHDYKRKSKMGINRSHEKRRFDLYLELMEKENKKEFHDYNEWWNYYFENDKTYLTTSTENLSSSGQSELIPIENPDWSLFKSQGYAWKHGKEEVELLKRLHQDHFGE